MFMIIESEHEMFYCSCNDLDSLMTASLSFLKRLSFRDAQDGDAQRVRNPPDEAATSGPRLAASEWRGA